MSSSMTPTSPQRPGNIINQTQKLPWYRRGLGKAVFPTVTAAVSGTSIGLSQYGYLLTSDPYYEIMNSLSGVASPGEIILAVAGATLGGIFPGLIINWALGRGKGKEAKAAPEPEPVPLVPAWEIMINEAVKGDAAPLEKLEQLVVKRGELLRESQELKAQKAELAFQLDDLTGRLTDVEAQKAESDQLLAECEELLPPGDGPLSEKISGLQREYAEINERLTEERDELQGQIDGKDEEIIRIKQAAEENANLINALAQE